MSGRQVKVVVAFASVGAGLAARSAERSILSVVDERAAGEDLTRIGTQIPVQQIEMVGSLEEEEAARMGKNGVPPAEIVGAM